MSSLRIPASYIATGNNPGEIPVRDGKGNIAGVPVIYNSILADETAKLVREMYPTGFLRSAPLVGGNPAAGEFNKVFLDAVGKEVEVLIRGYRLKLATNERIQFVLSDGPVGGYRDDLLFLEVWFPGLTSGGRTISHRWRIVEDVDFTAYAEGLDDPTVKPLGGLGLLANVGFAKMNPVVDVAVKDPGVYTAAVPAPSFDSSADVGLDGNPYYLIYGIPVARVRRINKAAYDNISNPNGSDPGGWVSGAVSSRPDGFWHNVIDPVQIIDLRHNVDFSTNLQKEFERSIYDQFTNHLISNGAVRKVNTQLGNGGLRSYFGDIPATRRVSLSLNMLRNSHFASVENTGVATLWTKFYSPLSSNLAIQGLLSAAAPQGQDISRPASTPEDKFGIKTSISGFKSQHFTVRVGYTPRPALSREDALLVLEFWPKNADVHLPDAEPLFSITSPYLTQQTETLQEITGHFHSPFFWEELDVYVFTVGTSAQLTLNYLDIKADSRLLPVIELEDGSEFVIKRTGELADVDATLPLTGVVVLNGVTGATIPTSSVSRVDGYNVQVQLGQAPAQADVKVEFDVEFPSGGGFPEIYETPIKFEQTGAPFVGFISPLETTKSMTSSELGLALAANTTVTVVNPTQGAYGVKARFVVVSNGGLSYKLPATVQGAKLAVPLTLSSIQGGLETNLSNISSVKRNSFRTALSAPSAAGQATVTVSSATGIEVGSGIYVGAELKTVSAVSGTTLTLDSGLVAAYNQGQLVSGDDRYTVTLSGSPVASGQNIYVEAALEAPAYVTDPKANGVSKLFKTVVVAKPVAAAATLFIPLPGLLLGRIVSTVCSSVFVNGAAEPSGGVTVAVASGGLQLTFTSQKTGLVEVAAQVEYELDESLNVAAYYSASVPALVSGIPATAELELLTEPKLFVHTKGTGGADTSGTFTELPFVRDPNLAGASIALSGGVPVRPFIADVPVIISKLGPLPLFAGRKFQLQDLQAEGFEVEGVPLSASLMHRTVLMAYVNYQGTRLLLVVERNRLDNRTRVSSDNPDPSAPQLIVGLYQPNGRPIAVN
jgi:hypothetical protein